MAAKYIRDIAHASLSTHRHFDSSVWRRMLRSKDVMVENTRLLVYDGSFSFWFENWLGEGPLANDQATVPTPEARISDFYSAGTWNLEALSSFISSGQRDHIRQFSLTSKVKVRDELVWWPTPSGRFSVSPVFSIIRQWRPPMVSRRYIWSSRIPLRISIFMWRLLNQAIPLADVLEGLGFNIPSKCPFCSSCEIVDHLFSQCPLPKDVWNFFERLMDISSVRHLDVLTRLQDYWARVSTSATTGHLLSILPSQRLLGDLESMEPPIL